jgi:hypothetical protein
MVVCGPVVNSECTLRRRARILQIPMPKRPYECLDLESLQVSKNVLWTAHDSVDVFKLKVDRRPGCGPNVLWLASPFGEGRQYLSAAPLLPVLARRALIEWD